MNIIECFKAAAGSIMSNRLRSFLTMLGIIIGIASVIAIVSIGEGGRKFIMGQFEKIGINIIEVGMGDTDVSSRDYFTLKDIGNIKNALPEVKAVSTMVNKSGKIKNGNVSRTAYIAGVTEDYSLIFSTEMIYGRFINSSDVLAGKNVIVIDSTTADKLFGYNDCIGMSVKIGGKLTGTSAIVVGVMRSSSDLIAGFAGDSMPSFVYVPVTFLKKIFPDDFTIGQLEIGLSDRMNGDITAERIIKILERFHHNSDKYKALNLMRELDKVNSILNKFTLIISAIAAISLIVGGIGIMNIMLVSVSERTREIGIRKALGASRTNILAQFLTEAVIISMIGGFIGLVAGYTGGYAVGRLLGLSPQIPPWIVLLVVGLTSMVGIFFGMYPASKASRLNPIEALRHE